MKKDKQIYAKDYNCCKCNKKAVCFWPMVDPDIPHHPYCRECVEKSKIDLIKKLQKIDDSFSKKQIKAGHK